METWLRYDSDKVKEMSVKRSDVFDSVDAAPWTFEITLELLKEQTTRVIFMLLSSYEAQFK
jgi:hypothetical protein